MKIFDGLLQRARENPRHIVLAEGTDERIIAASVKAAQEGIAEITLLGNESKICKSIKQYTNEDLNIKIVDPLTSCCCNDFAAAYQQLRKHKGVTLEQSRRIISEPLQFSAMMVREGRADGSVAGAVYTTSNTVRSAIHIIGLSKRYKLVSSFFLILLNEPFHAIKRTLIFADCGLVVEPDAEDLAQIAVATADSTAELLQIEPRLAMLSFSTHRSASHPAVDKVVEATRLAHLQRPDLIIDGDLQLDAALIPAVSQLKAPGSEIAGCANVLIFPSLEAGNIGYKLVERIAQAKVVGPILQGLNKPANDLSRGCSSDDVFRMIAVTVVQAV